MGTSLLSLESMPAIHESIREHLPDDSLQRLEANRGGLDISSTERKHVDLETNDMARGSFDMRALFPPSRGEAVVFVYSTDL